ncbi:MAG TPA: radical SAM protein [Spirochaetaceae bacterium]|nr:radical SAM protein [Spirochaetaceae bacterium]
MKYIFGPVPSRRLGRSLGIDPTPATPSGTSNQDGPGTSPAQGKICNWNCVYCQLGHTRPYTKSRSTFYPPEAMFAELRESLQTESSNNIDWITFVGSGEPTLNQDLGAMIRGVKTMTALPVAVITNGSLLSLPEVREALSIADAVLPTLDAGSATLFRRINRPHPDFGFERHIKGLIEFGREYPGRLWLEVMLIAGLNDDEASLECLAATIAQIGPDEVHLVLPTRPPVESWVRPSGEEGIARAQRILGRAVPVLLPLKEYGGFSAGGESDPSAAAAAILRRHPMSDKELREFFRHCGVADAESAISDLQTAGKAIEIVRGGVRFWRAP